MSEEQPKANTLITPEQLLPFLEELVTSVQSLETQIEQAKTEVIEAVATMQSELEAKLEDIEFEEHYPGMD